MLSRRGFIGLFVIGFVSAVAGEIGEDEDDDGI